MPVPRTRTCVWTRLIFLLLAAGLAGASHAIVQPAAATQYAARAITCEAPVRLTQDCSAWHGAARAVAFDRFRMALAADADGRTILVSRVHLRPNHNGAAFQARSLHHASVRMQSAIDALQTALRHRGICLERVQAVRRGGRIDGYFLSFSADAYEYLKQFTVLDYLDLAPRQQASR